MIFLVNPRPPRSSRYGLNAGPLITDTVTRITVSSLDDSGAGTLRDAIENATDDTIINFSVAGDIDLTDVIERRITDGDEINNLWIRGESAPGPVTIRNLGLGFYGCTDIHISHLRFECGIKYGGGLINDFIDEGGGIWSSSNFQWERFSHDAHLAYAYYKGVLLTKIATYSPSLGEWAYSHSANKVYVNVGEDPATDGGVLINLTKADMPDPLTIENSQRVLIRNCSCLYGTDISIVSDNNDDFAIVNTLVANALDWYGGPKGEHSKAVLFKKDVGETMGKRNCSFRNAYLHCVDRTVRFGHGNTGIQFNDLCYDCSGAFLVDFRNLSNGYGKASFWKNVLYPTQLNWSNPNLMVGGPKLYVGPSAPEDEYEGQAAGEVYIGQNNLVGKKEDNISWEMTYLTNVWNDADLQQWSTFGSRGDIEGTIPVPTDQIRSSRHDYIAEESEMNADEVKEYVQIFCGAFPWNRHATDAALFAELDGTPSTTSDIKEEWSTVAPGLLNTIVSADGDSVVLRFSDSVTVGTDGWSGFTLVDTYAEGGASIMTYSSGDGTSKITFTLSRTIEWPERPVLEYTQAGDGIQTVSDGTLWPSQKNRDATFWNPTNT